MSCPTLAVLTHGRDNNFNLIRMIAAYGVLVSHAYPLSTPGAIEPFTRSAGMSLGSLCVAAFFTISGFFIAKSFVRRSSVWDFALARAARILPALAIVTLVTVFLLGPAVTRLPLSAYFGSKEIWAHLFHNVTLYSMRMSLPGVFDANPYGGMVNGSLWTLSYEVGCYVILALALLVAGRRMPLVMAMTVALAALYAVVPVSVAHEERGYRLAFSFFLGAGSYLFARSIPLHWLVLAGLAGLAALLHGTAYAVTSMLVALGYGSLWLGAVDARVLRRYNGLGDYSYGTYILAFPVQQTFAHLHGPSSPLLMIVVVTPVVIGMAVASWTWIEKPCLEHRHVLASMLSRRWRGSP